MKAPKIKRPWIEILLLTFLISLVGFCSYESAHAQVNYVEPIWQENFVDDIEDAKTQFQTDCERDMSDMGIVMAQKRLEKRIYFILSKYTIELDRERRRITQNKSKDFYEQQAEYRKLDQAELMEEDAERLQAEEEERQLDQAGTWKDMTNQK